MHSSNCLHSDPEAAQPLIVSEPTNAEPSRQGVSLDIQSSNDDEGHDLYAMKPVSLPTPHTLGARARDP